MSAFASGVGLIPEQNWDAAGSAGLAVRHRPDARLDRLHERRRGRLGLAADLVGGVVRAAAGGSRRRAQRRPARRDELALRRAHAGHDDADGDEPGRRLVRRRVAGHGHRHDRAGQPVYVSATNTDVNSATTTASTTAAADGSFSVDVAVTGGTNVLNIVAVSATGGTAHAKRTVLFDFVPGTVLLDVTDPDGDDNGPGNYAYPTAGDFKPGAFDIQQFQVYDAGSDVIFRLKTRDLSPTFGSPLGAQLVDVYVHVPGAATTSTAAANRDAQLRDRAAVRLEPADPGAGLRPALRGREPAPTLGTVVDQRQLDLALHHRSASRRRRSARPAPGWGFTVVLTGQDGFSSRPGQRLPADAAALPVRRLRRGERRPALHVQPGHRPEGDRRDHAAGRAPVGRARLHDPQPGDAQRRHDSVGLDRRREAGSMEPASGVPAR